MNAREQWNALLTPLDASKLRLSMGASPIGLATGPAMSNMYSSVNSMRFFVQRKKKQRINRETTNEMNLFKMKKANKTKRQS